MAPTPGILYVTMQPKPGLPDAQFHDWYNNEHGPTRLRLPFVENGFRYRATDLQGAGKGQSEWMAIYDITDMAELTRETYTRLREDGVKSPREKDTMKEITVDRRLLDFVHSWESTEFKHLEEVGVQTKGNVMVAVGLTVHPGKVGDLDKWYDEEHVAMLSKVPGWLRTRRFVTSSIDSKAEKEYLALHEYAPENGLAGDEFKAAISTPWATDIMANAVKGRTRRVWGLYYTFGPAPRDLSSLSTLDTAAFTSPDGQTRTFSATADSGHPAIESYITTEDGAILPYKLEGSSDPDAPLIVCSNCILVDWGIWDNFLTSFFSSHQNKKYRLLRYLSRGRSSNCGSRAVTVDVLASDVMELLDALMVPKAAALIGVSLGGATVLNAALKHSGRVAGFVSCDTNAKAPEGNRKAWGERIAVAAKEGLEGQAGEPLVGERLAEMTARRWFVRESYDGGKTEADIRKVKAMIQNNSLQGFEKSVEALYAYDMTSEMKGCNVRGAFIVGGGDGILPGTMKEMASGFGSGAECIVIDGAGHLPMVEKPREFADAVTKFLN